ncbi:hypothetical protein BOSE21B_10932 [Bosea sp. 21B]|nr:hypothetical protein BOSE21B_10932 [Bosea sp. 21B]
MILGDQRSVVGPAGAEGHHTELTGCQNTPSVYRFSLCSIRLLFCSVSPCRTMTVSC